MDFMAAGTHGFSHHGGNEPMGRQNHGKQLHHHGEQIIAVSKVLMGVLTNDSQPALSVFCACPHPDLHPQSFPVSPHCYSLLPAPA